MKSECKHPPHLLDGWAQTVSTVNPSSVFHSPGQTYSQRPAVPPIGDASRWYTLDRTSERQEESRKWERGLEFNYISDPYDRFLYSFRLAVGQEQQVICLCVNLLYVFLGIRQTSHQWKTETGSGLRVVEMVHWQACLAFCCKSLRHDCDCTPTLFPFQINWLVDISFLNNKVLQILRRTFYSHVCSSENKFSILNCWNYNNEIYMNSNFI